MEQQVLLRPEQVAKMAAIGRTLVWRELMSGRLRSIKVGKRRLVPAQAVSEWIDRMIEEETQ